MKHFCSKGRTLYIVKKFEKFLDMGELTFGLRNCMLLIVAANQNACLTLAQQTTLKLQHTESDDFAEHYIIKLSGRELVLPPSPLPLA